MISGSSIGTGGAHLDPSAASIKSTGTAQDNTPAASSDGELHPGHFTLRRNPQQTFDDPSSWQVLELDRTIEFSWPAIASRLHLALKHLEATRAPFHFEYRCWSGNSPRTQRVSLDIRSWNHGPSIVQSQTFELTIDAPQTHNSRPPDLLHAVIVHHAHDVFIVTEAEPINAPGPRIIYVNPAATPATGYTPAELIGHSPRILQGPLTDRSTLDYVRHCIESWQSVRVELQNYRKDGTIFWVEIELHPVADETGWWIYWVSVQRDITVRKESEMLRAGQTGILRQIAAAAPLGTTLESIVRLIESLCAGVNASILLFDADSQTLRHGAAVSLPDEYVRLVNGVHIGPAVGSCGTAAYMHRSVEVDDIASDPLWPEPYRSAALQHNLRACWSTPVLNASGVMLGTFALYANTPRSISSAELHALDSCIELASIAIENDLTRSEAAEYRHRYLHLFHHTPQAMLLYDAVKQRFTLCNTAAQSLYGYTAHEFHWLTLSSLFADRHSANPDSPNLDSTHAAELFLSQPPSPTVWQHRRKDGSPIAVELTSEQLQWESAGTLLIYVTDVTERELALQLAGISRD